MEILSQPLLVIAHLMIIFSFTLVHGIATIKSCNQTPYPKTCNHFMIHTNFMPSLEQNSFTFRDQSLRVTMNKAKEAHHLVSSMDSTLFEQRAKLAWLDCLELYEDSVDLINRSISTKNPFDSQTWLSAAIANHQTCQNGYVEHYLINSSTSHSNSFPFMLNDFRELLSNSLAINKANVVASETNGRRRLLVNGFPSWVSAADRKLLQSRPGREAPKYDVVVAQDGSGNYKTISEAVEAVAKSRKGSSRFVIHVKAGVYRENIKIKKVAKNLMMIGDGIDATIITSSKNAQDGSTTFRSATFAISAEGFIARDITFENTAGPHKHQAVALRSGSDFSAFYRCSFRGYQDTLYVYSKRQFYRDCDIYGTVDFIFGDADAMFQNCNIYVRKPKDNQINTVTAQGRSDENENTGIVIHNSRIMAAPDLRAVQGSYKTYLGRPWKKYSKTVILRSFIDGLIDPRGWLPWSGDFGLSTLYYGEYMNTGSGASTGGRVKWKGFHLIASATEVRKFTVGNFLDGEFWIPPTVSPFFYSGI